MTLGAGSSASRAGGAAVTAVTAAARTPADEGLQRCLFLPLRMSQLLNAVRAAFVGIGSAARVTVEQCARTRASAPRYDQADHALPLLLGLAIERQKHAKITAHTDA